MQFNESNAFYLCLGRQTLKGSLPWRAFLGAPELASHGEQNKQKMKVIGSGYLVGMLKFIHRGKKNDSGYSYCKWNRIYLGSITFFGVIVRYFNQLVPSVL